MLRNLVFITFILSLILVTSCGEEGPESTVSIEDQQEFLANVGDNIIVPAYTLFSQETSELVVAGETFLDDITEEKFLALRIALKDARLAWQSCNFYDFGPASDVGMASIVNTYPIDRNAIEANIDGAEYNLASIGSADERGFAAIGYLLHGNGETDAEIMESFASSESRRTYLSELTGQISEVAATTLFRWQSVGDDYISSFKENTGTNVGASLSLLTNAVTQSLERKTRDGKIGIPSGLRTLGVPVPEAVEALYAGYSIELARANFNAYFNLFQGNAFINSAIEPGMSYLEYLELLENKTLADDISDAFRKTIISVGVLDEPYNDQVVSNPTPSNTAVADIQQLVVLIKSEMSSAMGISITFQDNDGD
ncbi:MAG: imelysin family protein [Cyclobacteriaceae bacterium]